MHKLLFLLFFWLTFAAGGGAMDPNGAASDDGPYIDPNGRQINAAGDKGMGLDPNG